jgi:hypothetical protein
MPLGLVPVDVDIELWEARLRTSNTRFKNGFANSEFGLQCSVCRRLWLDRDLTKEDNMHVEILSSRFSDDFDI